MRTALTFTCLVTAVLAASRIHAPSGCITVGSTGTYFTISEAIVALSTTSTSAQCIFIQAGTYSEQVYIPARNSILTIYGYTTDTTSYASNRVYITHSSSLAGGASNDDNTATVRNHAAGAKFYNINMKNTYGKGSQALAISAYATNQGYYGCQFFGYQDTILSEVGNQVYAKCYIEGAVDFIFGRHARTWLEGCDIRVSAGGGAITADGPSSSSDDSFFVINKSSVDRSSSSSAGTGSVYLGRPWSQWARVCFQNTVLGSIINGAGWEVWSTSSSNTGSVTFEEYDNTGTGARGTRADFSKQISSAISISTILGSSYFSWVDTSYLS